MKWNKNGLIFEQLQNDTRMEKTTTSHQWAYLFFVVRFSIVLDIKVGTR